MASPTPLSKANTTFSLALLKKFGDDDKTANIFYSPFSISSALAMVMLGARGNTATQMSECLKTKDYQDDVHVSFAQLLSELNKADAPYALSVANRLYGEQSYQFDEDFLGKTKKYYNAELETVDFLAGSEAARLDINSWVQKQTQDKIKDLLAKGDVDSLSRLVLVNAMYFKSDWSEQFQQYATRDAQFRLNKILEMPYKGKELSMFIFLPNEMEDSSTGLEKLEKQLTYENFMEWTRPDLMANLFGPGMSPANDLVLSKVVHKAFVEVNEEGTEAAAATAIIMRAGCCMHMNPPPCSSQTIPSSSSSDITPP
ncbi:hypothetical protein PFLUV_G00253760 [Perca fluviatilis]|uniref:Serpin domain-containing protein n=1 Tax=Perca fluviatilis TaxID=8168 RepID=A0A6A5E9Z8_PERFL|nr:hypothetical protein PFLUV_G00253760 [Perca fluviatilis]